MAHAINYTAAYAKTPLLTRMAEGFANWLDAYAENHPRMRGVRALQAMSDSELAARNIKREDIVQHVFRSHFS
ncbi:hypothetical protein [Puniceibacterium sp. IMCC21224]|uniref:hypothetical protein n=1 Tax=Puniceibacterium sp. IMCC21224 TaxID=1618204 RepID=UPI00064D9E64|nr:hypothetical protein [Puniceibacterium sp. IMCC21224]KMK68361.1 hypothetical protein IMCC21224_113243 [Puniceibacterium sp. IMCC21224]